MAQTRQSITYNTYDGSGQTVAANQLALSPQIAGSDNAAFFATLERQLKDYNDKHAEYLRALNQPFQYQVGAVLHLDDFLFPHMKASSTQAREHEQSLKQLFILLSQMAIQATKARSGGFLGIGANDAAYQQAKAWLKEVGQYIESKIIETPWYVPVSKEAYLLTALSDSPEAFIEAQKDTQVEDYVKELNEAKKDFPKEDLEPDGSNFSAQVNKYIGQIDSVKIKFHKLGSKHVARISEIEAKRTGHWYSGIRNFFVDIFTSEKTELDALINRKKIAEGLEKSYNRLVSGVEWVKYRNILKTAGGALLATPATLNSPEIDGLREAVISLLGYPAYEAEAKSFVAQLKGKAIENLANLIHPDNASNPEALARQFEFLAQDKITANGELNAARIAVVAAIKKQAEDYKDPETALSFIEKLHDAKCGCLDGELALYLDNLANDYRAWKALKEKGQALIDGTLKEDAIKELRAHAIRASKSSLPLVKQAFKTLDERLREQVKGNVTRLSHLIEDSLVLDLPSTKELRGVIEKHFLFYTSDSPLAEEECYKESKTAIREHVNKSFERYVKPDEALEYIARWDRVNQDTLKAYDIVLWQDIQNKRNQFKSLELIQSGWKKLLSDADASQMTTLDVEHFIGAVLWLDKPNSEQSQNPLIKILREVLGNDVSYLQATAKQQLVKLKDSLLEDLALLAQASPNDDKRAALKHRLKFVTSANAMYTSALGEARKAVIAALLSELEKKRTPTEAKRYLDDLKSVLPEDLQNDETLSKAISEVRKKIVYEHFDGEYKKLFKQFESQLKFLQTGKLSLWEQIEATFTGNDPHALTEENMDKWRSKLLHDITSTLVVHARVAVDMAGFGPNPTDRETEAAVQESLGLYIQEQMKSLSKSAKKDLTWLTDLRARRARQRLDKIFGLEPDAQQVDTKAFMRRYLAVASHQQWYRNDKVLVEAGRDFIREFHQIAQHEGGFVTEVVAQLPKAALDAMWLTWGDNPEVKVTKSQSGKFALEDDIIGEVDDSRDTHVQVPRYLLLNMVLELIARDFDAFIRGELVDIQLLNERIEFAIPKLQWQARVEVQLNDNQELRRGLKTLIAGLNPTTVNDNYRQLVGNASGKAVVDNYGVITNFKECEKAMLDKIRGVLKDQLEILDGITPEKLDYSLDEEAIGHLNKQILILKDELERVQLDKGMDEQLRAEKTASISKTISSFNAQKNEYANAILVKQAQTKWVRGYQEYLAEAQKLVGDSSLTLRQFISQMRPCLFDLLDPQLASFCGKVRENSDFLKLLGEEDFQLLKGKLAEDLQGGQRNLIDIVREIPEDITRQLPDETADLVRQIQYRFADRFKGLMVKMLDRNNLSSVRQAEIREAEATATTVVPSSSPKTTATGGWFPSLTLFGKTTQPAVTGEQDKKRALPSVNERLAIVLRSVKSDVLREMLNQLVEAADANALNIDDLYGLTGHAKPSKPIAIARPLPTQDKDDRRPESGMYVGGPIEEFGVFPSLAQLQQRAQRTGSIPIQTDGPNNPFTGGFYAQ